MKRQANSNEPELKITLYQALIKKDNFELTLQKCTEIGVSAFVPILAERSEKKGFNALRALKVLKEAAEQSGRGIVPALAEPLDYRLAVSRVAATDTSTAIFHPDGEPIGSYSKSGKLLALNIFIGPEGGFSEAEIDFARDFMKKGRPLDIVSLGKLILRAETAGLVATGILLNR